MQARQTSGIASRLRIFHLCCIVRYLLSFYKNILTSKNHQPCSCPSGGEGSKRNTVSTALTKKIDGDHKEEKKVSKNVFNEQLKEKDTRERTTAAGRAARGP